MDLKLTYLHVQYTVDEGLEYMCSLNFLEPLLKKALYNFRPITNRAVQAQKMARCCKFWILKVGELYYPCSENKGTAKLICTIVVAYAKCWFSHEGAHIFIIIFGI